MEKMYRFLQSGESPDFGVFTENEERILPAETGDVLVERGVAEEVI